MAGAEPAKGDLAEAYELLRAYEKEREWHPFRGLIRYFTG